MVTEVHHVILSVGGHAEGQSADCLEKERSVRSAIRKMDVEVGEAARFEHVGEIEGVSRTQRRLVFRPVFPVMLGH
jgi:hypothetical protein